MALDIEATSVNCSSLPCQFSDPCAEPGSRGRFGLSGGVIAPEVFALISKPINAGPAVTPGQATLSRAKKAL